MKKFTLFCFVDAEALPLFRIERFSKPLVDKTGSKAPVSLLRVSSFTALCLTLQGRHLSEGASQTLISKSLDRVTSVLDIHCKPRGQICFSGGLFLCFPFFKVLTRFLSFSFF